MEVKGKKAVDLTAYPLLLSDNCGADGGETENEIVPVFGVAYRHPCACAFFVQIIGRGLDYGQIVSFALACHLSGISMNGGDFGFGWFVQRPDSVSFDWHIESS